MNLGCKRLQPYTENFLRVFGSVTVFSKPCKQCCHMRAILRSLMQPKMCFCALEDVSQSLCVCGQTGHPVPGIPYC